MQVNQFVAAYQPLDRYLYAFAMKLTGNAVDAADLMQETATRAFKYREQFKENTNFKAWIVTIMRNTFINEYRRKKRIVSEELEVDKTELNRDDLIVYNESESSIEMEELSALIAQLKPKYRQPFLMHYEGYSYQEIADEMGIILGTVKSRIHVARQQLKGQLEAQLAEKMAENFN
ncbi:MAG: RNA polymerase sigma factor [Bacteroidota bacterium]